MGLTEFVPKPYGSADDFWPLPGLPGGGARTAGKARAPPYPTTPG